MFGSGIVEGPLIGIGFSWALSFFGIWCHFGNVQFDYAFLVPSIEYEVFESLITSSSVVLCSFSIMLS